MDDPDHIAAIVDEVRREARYVVTDFSIELVLSKFKEEAEHEGDIYVPDYQRSLSWGDERSSYFIESLLLRVPVPPIFLYDVDGRLEIVDGSQRSEEHTSELQSLMRISYAVFCLKKKQKQTNKRPNSS